MQIMIEMPEGTFESVKRYYEQNQECYALCAYVANGKPLPKGHGRLVDADAMKKHYPIMENDFGMVVNEHLHKELDNEPTILEADKAESEDKE